MYLLDYSAAKLAGDTIRSAGYGGVVRYIDEPSRWGRKHTNVDEYRSHLAAGLKVYLVFEASTHDPEGGMPAGVANARRALAGANALGYTGPIFMCNDKPEVNAVLWRGYLAGAATVLGTHRLGAYGFRNAVDLAMPIARYFWQAGRRRDVADHVHFYQDNNTQVNVGGITCDRNLVLRDVPTSVVPGQPQPQPQPQRKQYQEDFMYIRTGGGDSGRPYRCAILSGPIFVGIGSPGEMKDAERAMAAGAPYQWVEEHTWNDFDRRSKMLTNMNTEGLPVRVVNP